MNAVSAIGEVLAMVLRLVYELINSGKSSEEAVEITKRNIQSLLDQVAENRADVDGALDAKHGPSHPH